jgi:hypothetical protein
MLALVFLLTVASSTVVKGPYPEGVLGSGFGCNKTCNSGNVNCVIQAKIATYDIPGSGKSRLGVNGQDVKMFTRTFEGVPKLSSPFCQDGYDGTSGPLGPCITVNPGQTMNIKIVNYMKDGMEILHRQG